MLEHIENNWVPYLIAVILIGGIAVWAVEFSRWINMPPCTTVAAYGGNTYRNPTLLAKIITTLDVISQGRAVLGVGTGWFELEHTQLGFEFGTVCTVVFLKATSGSVNTNAYRN